MAVDIHSHDANWAALRVSAAASVPSNYAKMGTAVGSDAVEAGTTDTVITATGHSAAVGDEIVMTSGGEDGEAREVTAVTANTITLEAALSGTPSATETFNILRPVQNHATVPGRIVVIKSTLDTGVFLSFDGSADHLYIEGGDDLVLDLKKNGLHLDREGYIYVKEDSTPSSGSLYVSVVR